MWKYVIFFFHFFASYLTLFEGPHNLFFKHFFVKKYSFVLYGPPTNKCQSHPYLGIGKNRLVLILVNLLPNREDWIKCSVGLL